MTLEIYKYFTLYPPKMSKVRSMNGDEISGCTRHLGKFCRSSHQKNPKFGTKGTFFSLLLISFILVMPSFWGLNAPTSSSLPFKKGRKNPDLVPLGTKKAPTSSLAGEKKDILQDLLLLAIQRSYVDIQKLLQVEAGKRYQRATFVQIGANDGKRNDPLHTIRANPHAWMGVMVEPQPEYFRRLVRYKSWGYANVAMKENCNGQKNTSFWLYRGNKTDPSVEKWVRNGQTASLNPKNKKKNVPNLHTMFR